MPQFVTNSAAETEALAARLAALLTGGEVVAFFGPMGAGKTAFTRGLVQALEGGDVVSSPTFALMNEYRAKFPVYHFDMYRVTTWDDLYSTGFFDYLDMGGVLVVEWSENIENALPPESIRVEIQKGETETQRIVTITGAAL